MAYILMLLNWTNINKDFKQKRFLWNNCVLLYKSHALTNRIVFGEGQKRLLINYCQDETVTKNKSPPGHLVNIEVDGHVTRLSEKLVHLWSIL